MSALMSVWEDMIANSSIGMVFRSTGDNKVFIWEKFLTFNFSNPQSFHISIFPSKAPLSSHEIEATRIGEHVVADPFQEKIPNIDDIRLLEGLIIGLLKNEAGF